MKRIVLLALLGAALFLPPRAAQAHAVVFVCAPRIGSTLAKPPSQIVCIFDGPLNNSEVTMMVMGPNGERVDKNDAHPFEGDTHSYAVSLDPNKVGDGIYQLNWFVYDKSDDTKTSGSVQFGVNTIVPPTPTVVLPGQVIVTPSMSQPASANSGASDLVSRFLIGLGVVLLGAMGFLYWRTRKQNKDAE
jgi:methionine-rich copper-binding protein CopC